MKFDALDYLEQGNLSVQTFINTPNGENQEVIYITLKAEAYFDTYADVTLQIIIGCFEETTISGRLGPGIPNAGYPSVV